MATKATKRLLASKNYYNDLVLAVQGRGNEDGTTFIDSSRYNHQITRQGTAIVTKQRPDRVNEGTLFSATNELIARLVIPNSPVFYIGTKDYTIEFDYLFTSDAFFNGLIEIFTLDGIDFPLAIAHFGNAPKRISLAYGSTTTWTNSNFQVASLAISGAVPPVDTWMHIAFSRKQGVLRAFLDGRQTNQIADSSEIAGGTNNPSLCGASASYGSMLGFISNFKFTMAGKYTQSFDLNRRRK